MGMHRKLHILSIRMTRKIFKFLCNIEHMKVITGLIGHISGAENHIQTIT